MSAFKLVVTCHQLAKQPKSDLLVVDETLAMVVLKYATHDRICTDLGDFFGSVHLVDGGSEEYTDTSTTGDQTGTVFALPRCPSTLGLRDIADSIVAAHTCKVRQYSSCR